MSINKLVDKVNGLLGKFPCYFQYDQMDCGPAALSAVSSYYGKKYSIQELREYCHLSKDGVSLLGIEDAANEIGFDTLAVRVTAEEMIKKHPFPCILHWDNCHFVVLYKIQKKFLVGVISMFLISSFYLFYSYRIPVSVIALLLIGITGSFISWLSLQTSLGYYNQKVQSVCHLIKGGDCFSVIHSVGSKLLRNISLSDLSFLFMVYSTITAYCAVFDYNILFINKLLIIPSVAIVVYSIIYQVYLRNYCVICLLTSVCVSLQVCVLENCFPLAFDCNACSINILIGLISICIAFFVKMTLRKMIMSHIEIDYKDQIYYNPQVLKYFFSNLRQIDADACTKLPLIPLGGNGEKNIIMVLSLSCNYCKDTYKNVRLLKFYHPSEYVIKLLIDTKTLDGISKYVFLKLIEMQETTDLEKACDDIFIYDIPIKRWLKKWGMPQDLSIELLNKKIQIVQKFEEKYCLDDVPALIIGNQVWPTTFYRFDDLLHNIQFIKSE